MWEKFGCPLEKAAFFDLLLFDFCITQGVVCKKRKKKYKEKKAFCPFLPRHYSEILFNWSSFLLPITWNFFQKRITSALLILSNMNDVV